MALQREPRAAVFLDRLRLGKAAPRLFAGTAARCEIGDRRGAALAVQLDVGRGQSAPYFLAGAATGPPSTLSAPKRFSYSFTTAPRSIERRLAANGLTMM